MKTPTTLPLWVLSFSVQRPKTLVSRQWLFLFGNIGTLRSEFRIQLSKRLPLLGQVVLMEDCLNRTLWYAGFAVDALIGMNVQHLLSLIEAFYGAHNDTVGVLACEAGLSNHMGHDVSPGSSD
jgi:hypothetical protein